MSGTVLIPVLVTTYFVPAMLGWGTKYAHGILLLNVLLGWTVLGWLAALIWAVSAPTKGETGRRREG